MVYTWRPRLRINKRTYSLFAAAQAGNARHGASADKHNQPKGATHRDYKLKHNERIGRGVLRHGFGIHIHHD